MARIVPHLWFDKEAKEAATLYASIFPDSKVESVSTIEGSPSGPTDIVSFRLAGQAFQAISSGPYFRFTPAISFMVYCPSPEEVDRLWGALSPGGSALMELGSYPFSERYGWLQDRFGLSWQLIWMKDSPGSLRIAPSLLFTNAVLGRAEEAMKFYAALIPDSELGFASRYGAGEAPGLEGLLNYASLRLGGTPFVVMDGPGDHSFAFNEALSFMLYCEDQAEIDRYWAALSAFPEAEQCGWLKDRFGLSWQIVPTAMDEMMAKGSKEQIDRVTQAFLKMKKFDLAELERAYRG
jgi:predicted 3-demethylubiquinone-9 3-methyltransferase (glyoxalase superfamily)